MRACPTCSGFVPDRADRCPNCRAPSRWRRLAAAVAGLAGVVTLMACYGAPEWDPDSCKDQDGDGYLPGCYNVDHHCDRGDFNCDCNDGDPRINPGAYDAPGDHVDSDCDGKDTQRPGWTPYPDAWVQDDAPPSPDGGP